MKDSSLPIWNPTCDGYLENPHEHLSILREQNPVHRGISGHWLAFKYEDVKWMLTSEKFRVFNLAEHVRLKGKHLADSQDLNDLSLAVSKWLFFVDPPQHREFRRLIVKIWNQYRVQAYIEEVVSEAIANLRVKRSADLVEEFAIFIPIKVLCKITGLDYRYHKDLRAWSRYCARTLEPFANLKDMVENQRNAKNFFDHILGAIDEKTDSPDDSFISRFLIQNRTLEEPIERKNMASMFMLLFFAGIETTISVFSQGILSLIRNPRQLKMLRENMSISHQAGEELIRMASPTQYTVRIPKEDFTIRGRHIRKNEAVWLCIAAANRDPEIFDDPENLNFTRPRNPHLGFGHGAHHCIGAMLARDEINTALPAFLNNFSHIELDPERRYEWDTIISNRGLRTLPVILQP
jgi:cytochrome P450